MNILRVSGIILFMEDVDKQPPKQLIPYCWKKGQSGNPNGRPKGKTLKEFAREYLESLPDDEKVDYLASLPPEIVWKMAEGMPDTKTDLTSKGEPIKTINYIIPANGTDPQANV